MGVAAENLLWAENKAVLWEVQELGVSVLWGVRWPISWMLRGLAWYLRGDFFAGVVVMKVSK